MGRCITSRLVGWGGVIVATLGARPRAAIARRGIIVATLRAGARAAVARPVLFIFRGTHLAKK